MRVIKILLAVCLAALALTVILTAVCVKLYLTPLNIQRCIQTSLERHLNRAVSIAAVEKESLRRVTLRDVIVHPSHPGDAAGSLSCPKVSLTVGLLPLIARRLLIQEVVLHGPSASVFLPQRADPGRIGPGAARPASEAPLALIVLPERFLVHNGRITVIDDMQRPLVSLDELSVTADDISFIAPFTVHASARMPSDPDAGITLTGTASPLRRTITADLALENVNLAQLEPLAGHYGLPLRQGRISGTATIVTDFSERMDISGSADIRDAAIELIPALHISLSGVPASLRVRSHYDFAQQVLTLDTIDGTLLSSPFSGSGSIRTGGGSARIAGTLRAPSFSLDNLFAQMHLPPDSPLGGLRLGGTLAVTASIDTEAGRPISPVVILEFNGNRLFYPGLGTWAPALSGSASIDAATIRLAQFKAGTENLSVTLAGDITDYQSWPPRSNVKVISSRADFQEMFSGAGADTEIGPFALGNLTLSGPISLGSIIFMGTRLDAVQGRYALENNTLAIQDLSGTIGGGGWFSLQLTADLGVRGLDYHAHLKLDEASLESLKSFFPGASPGLLKGTVSGTCALKGAGTIPQMLLNTLRGDADFLVNGVDLAGITILPELSRFIRPEAMDKLGFSTAQIQLYLRSGVIDLTGYLAGHYLELFPQGEIGLDATLNLSADLLIAPDIFTDSMGIARYLPHRGDKVSLPVTIRGTLDEPRLGLAEETMQYLIREALPRMLMDIMSSMQDERSEGAPGAGEQEQQ